MRELDKTMSELSLFDFLPEEEAARFKPLKSDDWKWTFTDYPKEKNGLKVFSCFACGGGSTMGYKLAGCDVIGCCEIDPKMNEIYVKNHHPKHNFLMDIRDFNAIPKEELPAELFDLDILDGSPPCTTFSMAGQREDSWGEKKKFREGQKEQTLDDLSFVFIETVKKLRPKVVIMENVEGLILGEAFNYVQQIYKQFHETGYTVCHWLLKGEQMGVPQRRHRVFFIACRNDLKVNPELFNMSFNYEPVTLRMIRDDKPGHPIDKQSSYYRLLQFAKPHHKSIKDIRLDIGENSTSGFNDTICWPDDVPPTLRATGKTYDAEMKCRFNKVTACHMQTFPEDYDFCGMVHFYILGMSVPPIMTKRIVNRLIEEGVFSYKLD